VAARRAVLLDEGDCDDCWMRSGLKKSGKRKFNQTPRTVIKKNKENRNSGIQIEDRTALMRFT
jgi:hypothetical protein